VECAETLKIIRTRVIPGKNSLLTDHIFQCTHGKIVFRVMISVLDTPPKCAQKYYAAADLDLISLSNGERVEFYTYDYSICSFDGAPLSKQQIEDMVVFDH